ncbi:hypothetical protein [Cohnella abietis]|uniref:Uncharacterized protein n=1 Tax=Cohnella abietis TaxID=2507935 RepID=A0A3T1CZR5_9BACL|nr:hypothetical protein [Cohnella abietis]BBI31342.1 hypothetical protein KCTCHS21_07410 [Cohnella abietis]
MSKWIRLGLVAMLLLLWVAPVQVSAYSYGDANTEDIAETFKLIEASLSGASPNWKTVREAYKTRRSEIKSHFGEAVAITLDKNIEAKEAELLTANFKAVLVLNLDRRFTYASKDVKDYAGAKLLLAKAKATFDTLAPYISSGTDEINKAFDDALDALGNPGLFGVGKKEVDPETFKERVGFIHKKVKPLFPYKAYVKPAPEVKEQEKLPVKPQEKPTPSKEPVASIQPSPDKEPVVEEVVATPEAPATPSASATPSPSPSEEPQEEVPSSPEETASESASASPSEELAEPTPSEPEPSETPSDAEHAPMERADKTNTGVTVLVIGGVIVLGGGVFWFIRKKGFI